jgi:two-component system sensor histidine kinase/response regulator
MKQISAPGLADRWPVPVPDGDPSRYVVAAREHPHPTRVLVVDDQASNIQVIGGVLGKLGFEVKSAPDGATALAGLASTEPDLILLDVMMPGMDGVEICRRIRANQEWADIPIIFLSAADDKELVVRALEAGGVDFVTKPFNHAELISRVRTHLALKGTRDRLRQVAEDKDELLGILAHDLKNHLGGMQMSASLLRERMDRFGDTKMEQLCGNICHSTGQLLSFVKEFLANSATDREIAMRWQCVNLNEAVTLAAQEYQEIARRKDLDLCTVLPDAPVVVTADRRALDQVLDNLISNAIKFSPDGRQITVRVQALKHAGECAVEDQGPGFSAKDKARMFRRYGRLSARPTGGEPSTGLGLSIVKKLVHRMEGELICDSLPGQGATFIVRLPRTANPV